MAGKVYNFGAGPAMLPEPVMQKIQKEWLDYQGMGVSVIEISHRAKEFIAILEEAQALFRELTDLPDNYRILFIHGGARMQFSALPLNLAGRKWLLVKLHLMPGSQFGKFLQIFRAISLISVYPNEDIWSYFLAQFAKGFDILFHTFSDLEFDNPEPFSYKLSGIC